MRKPKLNRQIIMWLVFCCGRLAMAAPGFGNAGNQAASDVVSLIATAGTVIGVAVVAIGGGHAAWKAAVGEEWTKSLALAAVGASIAAISF
jgi:hypothetical protein